MSFDLVGEIPGIYGTFKIEELVLQRIWAEQDFFTDCLVTPCGRKINVLQRGEWNRSEEGPDFKNAKLLIDGQLVCGDIEIHLHFNDWQNHGHDLDSNYNKVILHICIFETEYPNQSDYIKKKNGTPVLTLFLLPFLYRGLEEYAEAHAVAQLSGLDSLVEAKKDKLVNLNAEAIEQHISHRWELKIGFAEARLSKQDWTDACHQWFLEILGYSRNRIPMARVSQKFSFKNWQSGRVDPELVYHSEQDWRLRGCRPVNHPKARLVQYARLWSVNPNWMGDLNKILPDLSVMVSGKDLSRKEIIKLSKHWRNSLLGGVFAEGKANTLWVDFALPILSAKNNANLYKLWKNWPCGDCPNAYRDLAKIITWTEKDHGKALTNGMVQCIISVTSR